MKVQWEKVIKNWLLITLKKITPIFLEAIGELWDELIRTFTEENFNNLKELKKMGDDILEQQNKEKTIK